MPAPQTYTKIQAATTLGIPVKMVSVLIQEGKLKTIALPAMKRRKILKTSVDALYATTYGEAARS